MSLHFSSFVTFALAPLLLLSSPLSVAAVAESSSTTSIDTYFEHFYDSPKVLQDACLNELEIMSQFLEQLPPGPAETSEKAHRIYLINDVKMRLLANQSYLAFDLPPLYKAYIKEYIEINQALYNLCVSDAPLNDILIEMRTKGLDLEQLYLKPCYRSIAKQLGAWSAICHLCGIYNESRDYKILAENHEPKYFVDFCIKKQSDFLKTTIAVFNGQLDLKNPPLPLVSFEMSELKRVRNRMETLAVSEWFYYQQMEALKADRFTVDFMRGDCKRKAFIMAYLGAEFRYVADTYEHRGESVFDSVACFANHMKSLGSANEAYAGFWEASIEYQALKHAAKASVVDDASFKNLCEQQPEAASYFNFVNLDSVAFRAFYIPEDVTEEYCKEGLAQAQKQLKDHTADLAEYIHYSTQMVYARALAKIFDEFADLYQGLAR